MSKGPDVAAELKRLDEEVRACTRCDLHSTATNGVPGEGPSHAQIMFIGEAPGGQEDKLGRPFVGAAGSFLNQLLEAEGLERGDVYITNLVKHRPPNNRDPLPDELAACRPWLDRQIELINPRLIVMLGRFALDKFFPNAKISQVHGQVLEKDGRHYFPMYHPAVALYNQSQRPVLMEDMKKLAGFLRNRPRPADGQSGDEESPEQLSMF